MSDWIKRFLPFGSLIALCVLIAALEPKFLSSGNLAGVARQTAVIMIMAIGMTIVMVSGGIDLSVGSVMALAGVAGALAMTSGLPVMVGIAACAATGAVCGMMNGAAIAALRIPSFIVTLGAMGIYRGAALLITDGKAVLAVTFDEFQRRRLEATAV
jgi:ribose transport system permease protein